MGGHIFDHIQGHIKGVFRPGVVPTGKKEEAPAPSGELIDADVLFNTATGWTLDPEWTIAGGQLVGASVGNDGVALANLTSFLDRTKTYRLSGECASLSVVVSAYLDVGTLLDGTGTVIELTSTGTFSQDFVPDTLAPSFDWEGSMPIFQITMGNVGDSVVLDSVSIMEV